MDIRRSKTCEKCKTTISLERVRLIPSGKDTSIVVCDTCLRKSQITAGITPRQQPSQSKPIKNIPKTYSLKRCRRCKYDFRIDVNNVNISKIMCPYCGRSDSLETKY